jgi:hypothetical protein
MTCYWILGVQASGLRVWHLALTCSMLLVQSGSPTVCLSVADSPVSLACFCVSWWLTAYPKTCISPMMAIKWNTATWCGCFTCLQRP